jgi:hypothetical protein
MNPVGSPADWRRVDRIAPLAEWMASLDIEQTATRKVHTRRVSLFGVEGDERERRGSTKCIERSQSQERELESLGIC